MAGGIKRPLLPSVGLNPDEQRLRTGLGSIIREFLDSGAVVARLFPGTLRPIASGESIPLAWGEMNRLPAGAVNAWLPQIRSEWIGHQLSICKPSPTGTAFIQPAGVGTDGKTRPKVDGFATGFEMTAAGQRQLITDGVDWFTSSGRASSQQANATPIVTVTASMLTLDASYVSKYVRFENGCLVTVPSGAFSASDEVYLRQAGAGQVILNQTGIGTSMQTGLLRPPASFKAQLAERGASAALFAVSGSVIDMVGHLEAF